MRTSALATALVAVLLGAGSARAETSIYVAEQPGFSITMKAEGRHVFVTSLTDTRYCRGTAGDRDEITEATGASFLGPPQLLERAGQRLHYTQKVTETFYDHTEIDAEIHPDAITGTYLSESSGPVEGDGGCQTGSPDGSPKVQFEAVRYVPFDSALATPPDLAAEAIYFSATKPIEIYLWVGGGSVTDIRGRAVQTCIRPGRPAQRSRATFDVSPPLAVSDFGSFFGRWGFRNGAISSSTRFSGTVADDVVSGWLSETWKARERGRVSERCHTGRGERGLTPYRATRYLPVATGS